MIISPKWWPSTKAHLSTESSESHSINLKLFNQEQLQFHARTLAAQHRVTERFKRDYLLPRLEDNERQLIKAYECITNAIQSKKQISPAGEWLLDNFHLMEEQIAAIRCHFPKSYCRELPHLTNTQSAGYPRVYNIALEVIAHVDGRVDRENISNFISAYQSSTQLTLGELWAIPIMLRIALIENLRRVALRLAVAIGDRDLARDWARKMIHSIEHAPNGLILVTADMARSNPTLSNAFVAEFVHQLHGHGSMFDIPLGWIENQLTSVEGTTKESVRLESQQQAANQVSVSASIISLRFLSAMDWRDFVEAMSSVDQILRLDPSHVYGQMDFFTRDAYRHEIESIAKNSGQKEWDIASKAIDLAKSHRPENLNQNDDTHVGYFLAGRGRKTLRAIFSASPLFDEPSAWPIQLRLLLYVSSIILITAILATLVLILPATQGLEWPAFITSAILAALCASQVALTATNWLLTQIIKPKYMPRLDFTNGVPTACRTLVVIPSLLINHDNIMSLINGLEIRYLANSGENIYFGLLTDFVDASAETLPGDSALHRQVLDGIEGLNSKYRHQRGDVFFLFHRSRKWNPFEMAWMGQERKRGKLEALNLLLRAHAPWEEATQIFSTVSGDMGILPTIKYVITLDTDTQLPRDAARKLIGAAAHPLNQPVIDPKTNCVIQGYSILQPRVAVSLAGSRRSWYVKLFANDPGIDPYTRSVSDVYQDLFQEGSYIGKGIYDVDAFSKSLANRLPDNLILSHDLLEGCHARCGLISDVLLYEEHPHHYGEDIKRRRRWIRGDWQIAFWLLPQVPTSPDSSWKQNPLSILSKWKIFDNLRRSLVSAATLALLVFSWFKMPNPGSFTLAVIALLFMPLLLTAMSEAMKRSPGIPLKIYLRSIAESGSRQLAQLVIGVIFLPYDAIVSINEVARSLTRVLLTKRRRLEWNSATDPRHSCTSDFWHFYRSMAIAPALSLSLLAALALMNNHALKGAAPLLILWTLSPLIAFLLSRPTTQGNSALSNAQTNYLHGMARKTWRFFETYVGPEDNWLPPDNFQEFPVETIAHRTSPTNIGLSLLANLAAFDFGYISPSRLIDRTSQTFKTLEKLERFRGHFYNWYDTQTLSPMHPFYISTVDSGNLAGLILTLKQGLLELPQSPIIPSQLFRGLLDTLALAPDAIKSSQDFQALQSAAATPPTSILDVKSLVVQISGFVANHRNNSHAKGQWEEDWWLQALASQGRDEIGQSLSDYAPWTQAAFEKCSPDAFQLAADGLCDPALEEIRSALSRLGNIPCFLDVAQLGQDLLPLIDIALQNPINDRNWLLCLRDEIEQSINVARTRLLEIDYLVRQCDSLAALEYDFLYDKTRHLLSIGYNVTDHRRDSSFYDLLASEARLCSFVGIAQGLLPQENWFALGRLLTAWNSEPTLLSWSGSMFEYLMPLLVMPTYPNTLLDRSYETAIRRQIAYGDQRRVPWGISESGYNATDASLNYQYRAFGVPGLGFKRGLAEDLVVAPYASTMALMISPAKACANMQRMTGLGYEGRYGFYEAVDFTRDRLAGTQTHAVVKSFMAHHQGMSFLALSHHLNNKKMQDRFHANPLFHATELLLHEKVPKVAVFYPHGPEVLAAARKVEEHPSAMRVITSPHTPRPEIHLLSNGRYSVMITNAGGGYSRWKGLAVTRWREDPTCDNWGTFLYIRDADTNQMWSSAYQPTLQDAVHYEAIFIQARAEFRRRDNDIETHTEITISPEDDVELRRFSITNLSSRRRTIEITSYAEVVLAPQADDEAAASFSNLFIQTEILAEHHAIICKRRPRSEQEEMAAMVHLMAVHGGMTAEVSYETDRAKFIGRGRSSANPLAFEQQSRAGKFGRAPHPPRGSDGSVLDPIVSITSKFVIEPEQTVKVHFITGIGENQQLAMELIEKYRDPHLADRIFELAWTHRQVLLQHLSISEGNAQLYGRLASSIIYANPTLRAENSTLLKNCRGQSSLWGYGISGDNPVFLLKIESKGNTGIAAEIIRAHRYWRLMALVTDLVILVDEEPSYRQPLQDEILGLVATVGEASAIDKPGGIFIRRLDQISGDDRILLYTVARAIVSDTAGTLTEQIERYLKQAGPENIFEPRHINKLLLRRRPQYDESPPTFPNGHGDFSSDGCEYIIGSSAANRTPAPWANVIANRHFGTVISESGGTYTWCENAHEYRLTPWKNDPLSDSCGEAIYIRDEETGDFWSPTPLPVLVRNQFLTRHGFGYSIFETNNFEITSKLTVLVAIDAPVKMLIVSLRNNSKQSRSISVTGYCEWVLGELRSKSFMHIITELDSTAGALFAKNPFHREFGERIGFLSISEKQYTVTGDRSEFLGRNGRMANPAVMKRHHLSGKVGAGLDACGAIQTIVELARGEEREIVFTLGVGRSISDARTLIRRFGDPTVASAAFLQVKDHWRKLLGSVQIRTPDASINTLTNGWLLYQVLASRFWGRSGYYQSSGAFGFRDQLQDAMALLHADPSIMRQHLIRSAGHQFREGDVQHWWHPPSGWGVRTHFSDDYLWLPFATCRYVLDIGDTGILDEPIHFIDGRPIKPDEEAYGDLPRYTEEAATLYEHCTRAIRHGLKFGSHGLPLMGCGDWNDGMNLVGQHGKGESVWLAFFLVDVLNNFAKIAHLHGDSDFEDLCLNQSSTLQENIEKHAWDGEWYRRAYFDDGQPLGSASNSDCQIDSLPQSWAVLSGSGDSNRVEKAMAAVDRRLVDRQNQIIKLFDPPFDKGNQNPGYIKGYVPGVRENGGQYTHAAIWAAMAFAALGNRDRAWEYLTIINPLNHTRSIADVAKYKVEPYVIAADVYAIPPHTGRGGWTWYTGSAGWTYRLILESILGIRLQVDKLYFEPCVPREWKGFEVSYQYRDTIYNLIFRPATNEGQTGITKLDGMLAKDSKALSLVDDHLEHVVLISY